MIGWFGIRGIGSVVSVQYVGQVFRYLRASREVGCDARCPLRRSVKEGSARRTPRQLGLALRASLPVPPAGSGPICGREQCPYGVRFEPRPRHWRWHRQSRAPGERHLRQMAHELFASNSNSDPVEMAQAEFDERPPEEK